MKIKIISTPNKKAFGGNLLSQGATWNKGYSYIGNGGSHESNPNEGVQVGVDPEGVPNLVEEGEVVWNDFVFSNRINMPNSDMKALGLSSKTPLTYAEAANKLAKEIEERPNDPLSKAALDKMLTRLAASQEILKEKRAARNAKKQFKQMSPEEQVGLMQMAQQAQMQQSQQEQARAEAGGNPYGELGVSAYGGPLMYAYGGPVNRFDYASLMDLARLFATSAIPIEKPKFTEADMASIIKSQKNYNKRESKQKYNEAWYRKKAIDEFEVDPEFFKDHFVYTQGNTEANHDSINNVINLWREQKDRKSQLDAKRTAWENEELEAGRYKKSDDGKSIYKAKFFTEDDVNKKYIGSDNTLLTKEDYDTKSTEYANLKKKSKPTDEEKKKIEAFEKASYKPISVVKGQFAKDYNSNVIYDYDNNVSDTWTPSEAELLKDYTWDSKNAVKLPYPIDNKWGPLSYLRFAPAVGGAIGLMQDVFSKPDYSRAEEIKNAGAYVAPTVTYKPLGNYLTYNPFDIRYAQNSLDQSAAATRRAILNTAGTRGSALSGLLSTDYNAQQQSGDLFRKAYEYNNNLAKAVEEFNRGTDQFNSQQDFNAQRANQAAIQQALRDKYQGIVTGNTLMDTIDARKASSMSANLTNMVNSLGQIGEENYDNDRLQSLIDRGVLKDLFTSDRDKKTAAYGGMLTKRKRRGGRR